MKKNTGRKKIQAKVKTAKKSKKTEQTFEVEIKTLLGVGENADVLRRNLKKHFPSLKAGKKEKQLNHYFVAPASLDIVQKNLYSLVPTQKKDAFKKIMEHGSKVSLRTRDTNGTVLMVIKASVGDHTSQNGVERIECEFAVPLLLAELDELLLKSGCTYQAKWSRERETYEDSKKKFSVCIDRNAGYGYIAEFEKVTTDQGAISKIKKEIESVMKMLKVEELPQDRLERMFAHYNAHWQEYYGTDKTFTIK